MGRIGQETHNPIIDIAIDTGKPETDEEIARLLESVQAEQAIRQTLQRVAVVQPVMLSLLITNDTEIQTLNRQYRQQDKPTDVLSFPLLDEPLVNAPAAWLWQLPEEQELIEQPVEQATAPTFITPDELATNLGDIAISWPTVERQALNAGQSTTHEFLFLLCHGVLHLVGYDDQTEAGYHEMVRLQTEILADLAQES